MTPDHQRNFFSRQLSRAARAATAMWRFQNPLQVLLYMKYGYPLRRLGLRGGPVIVGSESDVLYQLYQEIWCHELYTQGGFGIRPNSVVMDIGANIGVFALFAAQVSGVRVFAFEPHPTNYEFLQSNITRNKANVLPFPLAVAREKGTRQLWLDGASGGHRLYDRVLNGRLERWIEVQTETLAGAMSSCGLARVDFLKLDCEGAEYEILLNCSECCLSKIGMISLEFHDHVTPHTHHEIVRYLEDHGFTVRVPETHGTFGVLQARFGRSGEETYPR